MKKILVALLVILCSFTSLFGLEWSVSNDRTTLTISGEGAMPDFENKKLSGGKDIPWNKFSESITCVIIKEGITEIGANNFGYMFNLEKVLFPESLEVIGYGAFDLCLKLKTPRFPAGLKKIESRAFFCCDLIDEVTLPKDVEITEDSFSYETKVNIVGQEKEKTSGSF